MAAGNNGGVGFRGPTSFDYLDKYGAQGIRGPTGERGHVGGNMALPVEANNHVVIADQQPRDVQQVRQVEQAGRVVPILPEGGVRHGIPGTCCVCLEERVPCPVIVPCGHANVCWTCAHGLAEPHCPTCRERINKFQDVYVATE